MLHGLISATATTTQILRRNARWSMLSAALLAAPAHASPQIQHWTLESGTRVYYVESRGLPLIDIQVSFPAGTARTAAGKEGLAAMTQGLLTTGSGELDEQALAERMADTGAQFGGDIDDDRSSVTLRTLSSAAERDAAVQLAAQIIAQPTFPAAAFERERTRALAGLRDALTRPATLAARQFESQLYGNHPYGRTTTLESLQSLSRDDLVAFHRRHYAANLATVTIVGDASRDEADAIARTLTRQLPQADALPDLPQPELPVGASHRIANPSAQAHVLIGLPVLSREDPDYYPLLVGNYILGGGGFVSRLTHEVREKRGFVYSIYSAFLPRQVAGPFQINLQTRGSQVEEALATVSEVLQAFITDGPTEAELQAAKANIVNGFGLRLDSNGKLADHVAMIGFYQLPLDWLETYPRQVEAVSREAIRDAFARRVKPGHLITVVAGGDGDRGNASSEAP